MIAVAIFAAAAILSRASADSVSTSLLLPNSLFSFGQFFKPPTFVGQVTVIMSTTYYTLDCSAGGVASYFSPLYDCDTSYTFSEISASTQYVYDEQYLYDGGEASYTTGAASTTEYEVTQTWFINCGPLGTSNSATCTTTFETEDKVSTEIDPSYYTSIESSLYPVIFSTAVGYGTTSSTVAISASTATTSATPSPAASAPTAKPTAPSSPQPSSNTTATPSLAPSSKLGIGLGVPLGACALFGLALLLYRHGKYKERSRKRQMENLPPPPPIMADNDAKRLSEAGMVGRQPPVYSMEMQG